MSFTEKIVVAKISAKVMNSFKVMQFIYKMKSSVVALFSVNLMYSVNFMSVKVMLHCIDRLITAKLSPLNSWLFWGNFREGNRGCLLPKKEVFFPKFLVFSCENF